MFSHAKHLKDDSGSKVEVPSHITFWGYINGKLFMWFRVSPSEPGVSVGLLLDGLFQTRAAGPHMSRSLFAALHSQN